MREGRRANAKGRRGNKAQRGVGTANEGPSRATYRTLSRMSPQNDEEAHSNRQPTWAEHAPQTATRHAKPRNQPQYVSAWPHVAQPAATPKQPMVNSMAEGFTK